MKKKRFSFKRVYPKTYKERRSAIKLKINVPEVVSIFKEIKEQPEKLYEMIRTDIRETIGQYLSGLMDAELTHFLGRKPYERLKGVI